MEVNCTHVAYYAHYRRERGALYVSFLMFIQPMPMLSDYSFYIGRVTLLCL